MSTWTARSRRAIASRERKAPRARLQLPWRTWGASSRHDGRCRFVEARVRGVSRAHSLARAILLAHAAVRRARVQHLAEFHVLLVGAPRRHPRGALRVVDARRVSRSGFPALDEPSSRASRARGVASRRRRRDEERRLQERRRASSRRRPRATERPPSPAHRALTADDTPATTPSPGTTPTPTATTTTLRVAVRPRPRACTALRRACPSATPPTPSSAPRPAPASPPSASPRAPPPEPVVRYERAPRVPVPRAVAGAPRDGLGVQRGLRDGARRAHAPRRPPGASCSSPTGPSRDTSNSSPTPR